MKVKLSKCDFCFQYESLDFMYIGLDSSEVERKIYSHCVFAWKEVERALSGCYRSAEDANFSMAPEPTFF